MRCTTPKWSIGLEPPHEPLWSSVQRGLFVGAIPGTLLGLVDMVWSLHRSAELGLSTVDVIQLVGLSSLIVGGLGIWIGAGVGAATWWLKRLKLPFERPWHVIEGVVLSAVATLVALLHFDFFTPAYELGIAAAIVAGAIVFSALLWLLHSEVGTRLRGPVWLLESMALVYAAGRIVYEVSRTVTMGGIHAKVVVATLTFLVMAFYLRFSTLPVARSRRWSAVAVIALATPLVVPFAIGATASHQTRLVLSERTAITYRTLWMNRLFRAGADRQMPAVGDCDGPVEPPRLGPQASVDDRQLPTASHVVVIIIDALRHDRPGTERDGVALTKNLDRFAARSLTFDRAYGTTPSTATTVGSMVTGLSTGMDDLPRWEAVEEHSILHTLDDHGVFTATAPAHSYVADLMAAARWTDLRATDAVNADKPHTSAHSTAAGLHAARAIAEHDRGLMFVHYFDPHDPYIPPADQFDFGRSDESRYDGEIAYTDRAVGSLLGELPAILPDDHAVIVVSDHGEEFWDHGYRYHAVRLYDESVRLVAMMHLPGQRRGHTIDAPVSSADLAPTILDLFAISPPGDLEGRSWLRPLSDQRRIYLHTLNRKRIGFVDAQTKFIVNRRSRILELYDLRQDPDELDNLADQRPDEVRRYYCEMLQWKRERDNSG